MELLYSFLRFLSYLRNLNLFKLFKHTFFFILVTKLKMAKETSKVYPSKQQNIFKNVAKAKAKLN